MFLYMLSYSWEQCINFLNQVSPYILDKQETLNQGVSVAWCWKAPTYHTMIPFPRSSAPHHCVLACPTPHQLDKAHQSRYSRHYLPRTFNNKIGLFYSALTKILWVLLEYPSIFSHSLSSHVSCNFVGKKGTPWINLLNDRISIVLTP